MWVNLGGVWEKRRLHLKLAVISGDQLSQDYVCGRMAINSGNAGRIHRGCGSSAIHLGNALDGTGILSTSCRPPPTEILKRLNGLALLDVSGLQEQGRLNELLGPAIDRESRKQHKLAVEYLLRVKRLAKAILNKTFSMYELSHQSSAGDGIQQLQAQTGARHGREVPESTFALRRKKICRYCQCSPQSMGTSRQGQGCGGSQP